MHKAFKFFKYFFLAILFLITLAGCSYLWLDKPLPKGRVGPEAEALADRMLAAVNSEAWDSLALVEWTFPGGHSFIWDRKKNWVEVKWGERKVQIAPDLVQGVAFRKGELVKGKQAEKLVQKAHQLFWNDSYWLAAFTKIRDPGTERAVVNTEEGPALLVSHHSGGVTPGDAYLWMLDESGRPKAWQMWTQIVPIGGLEFTWEGWTALPNGAMVATDHHNFLLNVNLTGLNTGNSLMEMGYPDTLFQPLMKKVDRYGS